MNIQNVTRAAALVCVSWLGPIGCGVAPGGPSDTNADVPGDVSADPSSDVSADGGVNAPVDGGPLAAFAGDWTVDTWTVTRAVGSVYPDHVDAGRVDSPGCARVARENYRATRIVISASDGSVRVNDRPCEATVSGSTLTASCGCANSIHVLCSTVVTMRIEGAARTLRGEERQVSNTPAGASEHPYCTVEASFEASRR